MKMKYNFGPLKGRHLKFYFKTMVGCYVVDIGTLQKVKLVSENYEFQGSEKVFPLNRSVFDHMNLHKNPHLDCLVFSNLSTDSETINPLVGFTMFDVYGFPVELTQEILGENGYKLDVEGYHLLRELQKDMNKSTFKNKDCFGKEN